MTILPGTAVYSLNNPYNHLILVTTAQTSDLTSEIDFPKNKKKIMYPESCQLHSVYKRFSDPETFSDPATRFRNPETFSKSRNVFEIQKRFRNPETFSKSRNVFEIQKRFRIQQRFRDPETFSEISRIL